MGQDAKRVAMASDAEICPVLSSGLRRKMDVPDTQPKSLFLHLRTEAQLWFLHFSVGRIDLHVTCLDLDNRKML